MCAFLLHYRIFESEWGVIQLKYLKNEDFSVIIFLWVGLIITGLPQW